MDGEAGVDYARLILGSAGANDEFVPQGVGTSDDKLYETILSESRSGD